MMTTPFRCPHQDRCRFRSGSALKSYLETECEGFVKDPSDRYVINYIIVVLLADFKSKRLFDAEFSSIVYCSLALQKVFGRAILHLSSLRAEVKKHFFHLEFSYSIQKWFLYGFIDQPNTQSCLLVCPYGYDSLVRSLVPFENGGNLYIRYFCPKRRPKPLFHSDFNFTIDNAF